VCGSSRTDRIFAEASFAPEALDGFAFASRKLPEYMHYRIVACEACDVLYSSPTPTREFLETAYREAEVDASDESRLAAATYGGFLDRIARRLPDRKGALDIGTGDGAFLHQLLDHGFTEVGGVEPSAAPIALASPRVKSLIRQGLFRASDFSAGQFRLITCFQTMEHVDDPLGLCRDAHTLLRPGGALFLVCHNHRAVLARLMGLKSPIFDIEHLQLFSPKSIRKTQERAGFHDVEVHTVVNRYPVHYWAKLAPLPGAIKTPLLDQLKRGALGRLLLSVPVGNMAAIGYKRS
jgi:2-polyprenyl-3-methyl-5-hydroxy-6-metoxy-1,4-benzoquinol methylase